MKYIQLSKLLPDSNSRLRLTRRCRKNRNDKVFNVEDKAYQLYQIEGMMPLKF